LLPEVDRDLAQFDALVEQLLRVALSVLDQDVAPPRVVRREVVTAVLGGMSLRRRFAQPPLLIDCHPAIVPAASGYIGGMSEREQPPKDAGAGLPEDAPEGMGIDPSEHAENDVAGDDAPETTTPRDGDPGQASGNPSAAGADS
jgi:hypothetical protein